MPTTTPGTPDTSVDRPRRPRIVSAQPASLSNFESEVSRARDDGVVRVAVIGDLHWALVPPSGRTDVYVDECRAAIEAIVSYKLAVCTGDVFHRKSPPYPDVVALARVLGARLASRMCPLLTVPGNHDAMPGTPLENTAFGLLSTAGLINDLSSTQGARIVHADGADGVSVAIVGAAYTDDWSAAAAHVRRLVERLSDSASVGRVPIVSAVIAITHLDVTADHPGAAELVKACIVPPFSTSAIVLNGHLHSDRSTSRHTPCVGGMNGRGVFMSVGSAVRTSVAEAADAPSMVVVKVSRGGAISVSRELIRGLPGKESFVDDELAQEGNQPVNIDAIVEAVAESRRTHQDAESVARMLGAARNDPPHVIDKAVDVIRRVS